MLSRFSATRLWQLVCMIGVTSLLYWRRPDAFYNPQLWAEDGRIFFTEAYFSGGSSLFDAYAGYQHILARLTAWLGNGLPPQFVPHWYTFASWLLIILIVAYLFSGRFSFGSGQKIVLGLALVGTSTNNEVFFNLANWATLTTVFWLLLAIARDATSRWQSLFDTVLLFVTGFNSPFTIVLWLVFVLRWRLTPTVANRRLAFLSMFVAIGQLWNMPSRVTRLGFLPESYADVVDGVVYRFGHLFVGEQISHLTLTPALRVYALLLIVAFYVWLFRHAADTQNRPMLLILTGGLVTTALSIFVARHDSPANFPVWGAGRHFYLQALTLTWALTLANFEKRHHKLIPLTMIFVAFALLSPRSKNQVRPDLAWAEQIARCTGTKPACNILINPLHHGVQWPAFIETCVLSDTSCETDPKSLGLWFATLDSHIYQIDALETPWPTQFGESIELLGYESSQVPEALKLTFVWKSRQLMTTNYKLFVHVFNTEAPGEIVAQVDAMPMRWSYPTSSWVEHEIIYDELDINLTDLPSGRYQLAIGWYNPDSPTFERLFAVDAQQLPLPDNRSVLPAVILIP